jgi:hypothetical protein
MDERSNTEQSSPGLGSKSSPQDCDEKGRSLHIAIRAYTAHYLPAIVQPQGDDMLEYERFIRDVWRAARREMLRVINRVSYRSVITLYIFSMTPYPVGLAPGEANDGIAGVFCCQTALMQIQQLRGRLRSVQFFGAGVLSWSFGIPDTEPKEEYRSKFLDDESRVYWAALTWDTAAAVALNFRSSFGGGLKAVTVEPAWTLSKGFLLTSFQAKSQEWLKPDSEITDDIAAQILAGAGICRNYVWRSIASLKQALREAANEDDFLFTWRMVLEGLEMFRTIIRPLLDSLARRLHFLTHDQRFNYYETTIHYYLGVLLLVDAIEMSHRSNFLTQLNDVKLDAEREALNTLKFGLESTLTVRIAPEQAAPEFDCSSATVSFIAVDPIPHHLIALVELMHKSISRKLARGNIQQEAYTHLLTILLDAVKQCPQSSRAVTTVRESLEQKLVAG